MTTQRLTRLFWAFAISLFVPALGIPHAQAQTYSDIHDFDNAHLGGPQFPGMLAQGRDGNLYGTAPLGGDFGRGGIFQISPSGAYSVIYSFDNTIGVNPYSGLTRAADGTFLGAAYFNGIGGFGTAWSVMPGNIPTVLHSFVLTDGASVYAPPIQGTDGNIYGVTSTGGQAGLGTIYKITSGGVFSVLYQFDGAHGSTPIAPLIQATDGNFYGTTKVGGTLGLGTVFKITPAGALTVMYNFDLTHGSMVFSPLVQGKDGNFYGTTRNGGAKNNGGVVFKLTKAKKLTVLYSFDLTDVNPDGNQPYAGLVQATDANLYGVTSAGGVNGAGTLYKITTKGAYTSLYSFVAATGSLPFTTLRQHTNGRLYGEATSGGALNHGALFSFDQGLKPFISLQPTSGAVSQVIGISGQGLSGTKSVKFNVTNATFTIVSDTYITATVPAGATTGMVKVAIPGKTLKSDQKFRVTP